jgi:hypothetical protein
MSLCGCVCAPRTDAKLATWIWSLVRCSEEPITSVRLAGANHAIKLCVCASACVWCECEVRLRYEDEGPAGGWKKKKKKAGDPLQRAYHEEGDPREVEAAHVGLLEGP